MDTTSDRKMSLRGPQIGLASYLFLAAAFHADAANTIYILIAGIVFVGWFLISLLAKSMDKIKFFYPIKAFAVLLLLAFFGVLFHPDASAAFFTFIQIFVLFVCVSNLASLCKNFDIVENGILAAGLYNVCISINPNDVMLLISGSQRLTGAFGNPNAYAFFLNIVLMFCLKIFLLDRKEKPSLRATLALLLSPLIVGGVVSSGSRRGVITLFLIIGTYFVLALKKRTEGKQFLRKLIFLSISVAAIFFIIKAVTANELVTKRMKYLTDFFSDSGEVAKEGSMDDRAAMIGKAIELWKEKPILGWGLDRFRYESSFDTYAHNNYAELLCDMGLFGFLVYYSMFFNLLFRFLKNSRRENRKLQCLWGMSFLFILLFSDIGGVSILNKFSWFVIAYLTGVSESWKDDYDESAGIDTGHPLDGLVGQSK